MICKTTNNYTFKFSKNKFPLGNISTVSICWNIVAAQRLHDEYSNSDLRAGSYSRMCQPRVQVQLSRLVLAETPGGPTGSSTFPDQGPQVSDQQAMCAMPKRQCHSNGIPKETGKNAITIPQNSPQIMLILKSIARHLNVIAELASRIGHMVPSEWALCRPALKWIADRSIC